VARYTGPTAKRWRRIGQVPPDGNGAAVSRRNYPPGQHGLRRRTKVSEYGQQLAEKQKAKYTYGILERQFAGYYRKADQARGVTGETLMQLLEQRLDNVVFRLGLAATRAQARQAVTHGHVRVNDKKVAIPSAQVAPDDVITFSDRQLARLKETLDLEALKDAPVPDWLALDAKKLSGTVRAVPDRRAIDATINEQLIVEYYSR
jgi:small subunit ribosomal protein S4